MEPRPPQFNAKSPIRGFLLSTDIGGNFYICCYHLRMSTRTKYVYKDGFVDGMRNCGYLAIDIADESIDLSDDWKRTIAESYAKRNYSDNEEQIKQRAIQQFVYDTCDEIMELHERVEELEAILKEVAPERLYE